MKGKPVSYKSGALQALTTDSIYFDEVAKVPNRLTHGKIKPAFCGSKAIQKIM
jgi:hypothetical protein